MTTLLFDFFEKFKLPVTNAVMDHIRRLAGLVVRAGLVNQASCPSTILFCV
ncbi:MAG: hypothetical protein ACNI26_15210 [Terasakiella sp.]|uniref:hypothetical protein n=1 Tax=unclassified Terasakiella TaxID=2614952 RepID=UPI003B00CE75